MGRLGERLARKKIRSLGYKEITRNYRCPLGEVDLIAKDGDTLVFIEIKTRMGKDIALAKASVDRKKRRQISKVALAYMKSNECFDMKARFDVVTVNLDSNREWIEVIKDAFELSY